MVRLNGDNKEIIEEITVLARKHGIITPYTSYLILEDEEIRIRGGRLADGLQTIPPQPELRRENEADFFRMREKSGRGSVVVSEEFQKLNTASNYNQMQQGSERMVYRDSNGHVRNVVQQVKNISGRAVYQQDNIWVDSELQNQKAKNQKRIQFNSDEYFKLLKDKPETSQFLALGQNVRFYYENTFYEIYE